MKRSEAELRVGIALLAHWSSRGEALSGETESEIEEEFSQLAKEQSRLSKAYCQHFTFEDDDTDTAETPEEPAPCFGDHSAMSRTPSFSMIELKHVCGHVVKYHFTGEPPAVFPFPEDGPCRSCASKDHTLEENWMARGTLGRER